MEESDDEGAAEEAAPSFGPASAAQGEVPNPVLFAEGLPTEVTSEMLSALFQQCVLVMHPLHHHAGWEEIHG